MLKNGPGDGPQPTASTPCLCHYKGTLLDGTEFDSSYSRGEPATFAPNQVIRGWTEAMQLMREGDKWELFIPSELAYGDSGRGAHIKPGSVLVFELEILQVLDSPTWLQELLNRYTRPAQRALSSLHLVHTRPNMAGLCTGCSASMRFTSSTTPSWEARASPVH